MINKILVVAVLCVSGVVDLYAQTFSDFVNHPLREPFDNGLHAFKNGQYKRGIEYYTIVINQSDSTSSFDLNLRKQALIFRSFCKKGLRNFSAAIADLDRAVQIDTFDMATYIDRGTTYIEMNDHKNAKSDFKKVLQHGAGSEQAAAANYYLSKISFGEDKLPDALGYINSSLEISPNEIEFLFIRAYYYGLALEPEKAIADYDKILTLDPQVKEVYSNRGTQKINLYNKQQRKSKKLRTSACDDLHAAKSLGDRSVDDLIFVNCR